MKNIRSISTAALSLMLLLSTTASNSISFKDAFASLVNKLPTAEQVSNAGKAAVEAVKAHPYISTAVAATFVLGAGYSIYNALTKKTMKDISKNESLKQDLAPVAETETEQQLTTVLSPVDQPKQKPVLDQTFSQLSVKERTKRWENKQPVRIEAADDVTLANFEQAISGQLQIINNIINSNHKVKLGDLDKILADLKKLSNFGKNSERNRQIQDAARRLIRALTTFNQANCWDNEHLDGINKALEAMEKLGLKFSYKLIMPK